MDKILSDLRMKIVELISEYEKCIIEIDARPCDVEAIREASVLSSVVSDLTRVLAVMENQNG